MKHRINLMLLSELAKETTSDSLAFGVEVDCDILTPPKGLTQIALRYKGETDIADDLIDAIIAFSLAGVDVIVEVDHTQRHDPVTLLTQAGNAGFSISLIPPQKEEELQQWANLCEQWAEAYLSVPNFTKDVYPVSNYFGYLVAAANTKIDALTPTDPYSIQRFVQAIPTEWSDTAKAHIKKGFVTKAGSEKAFEALMEHIVSGILIANLDIIEQWEKDRAEDAETAKQEQDNRPEED